MRQTARVCPIPARISKQIRAPPLRHFFDSHKSAQYSPKPAHAVFSVKRSLRAFISLSFNKLRERESRNAWKRARAGIGKTRAGIGKTRAPYLLKHQ